MNAGAHPNRTLAGVLIILIWFASAACNRHASVPTADSKEYRDLCSAFFLGLAALQSGEDVRARTGLTRATEIAPGEPAGWVDLGLLQARQQEYDAAYQSFEKARTLVPDNSKIEAFLGLIESKRGKIPETLSHYQKAAALDPGNLRARYALASETGRQQTPTNDSDTLKLLDQILKLRSHNEPVLLDVIRLAAKTQDAARLQSAVAAIGQTAASWPQTARQQLERLQKTAKASDFREAAIQVQFLRNTLVRDPNYRKSLDEVKASATTIGEPFMRFVKLPSPTSEPAPPDRQLRFDEQPLQLKTAGTIAWIGSIPLDGEGRPAIVWADTDGVHVEGGATLPLPAGRRHAPGKAASKVMVVGADLNYDFKTDLVVATSDGIVIYRQETPQRFRNVTPEARLPPEILQGSYTGAWATDFDLDGDLDIVLGVPHGEPIVLRNNGDGTFGHVQPFKGVDGMVAFANADIDGDGVPDIAMIDSRGSLLVFRNERLGFYRQRTVPADARASNVAVAAGDVNGDGRIDFVLLRSDSTVARLSDKNGDSWEFVQIARGSSDVAPGSNLLLADLDNNGALDIVAGDQVFLADGRDFAALTRKTAAAFESIADVNQDGRLDGLAISKMKTAVRLMNRGSKNYKWQAIRTRAASVMGDQRINPFGIGGEIEIRSELLTQKQMITSPLLHFGLGDHPGVEFARIVWPNGLIQAEFSLQSNQAVLAQQRLKGSCPFLFAWDGARMQFLKDVAPMSAPLGAHVDSQTLERIDQTQQWFKIDGSQLAPRDGYYDLRLTDEYWETYYIDHYSLLAVDHPRGSHIFVDERVADPPAPLRFYVTAVPRPFASAIDDTGRDVSATVREKDQKYLEGFGVGQYQGLTRDHWVELALPPDAPRSGTLYLIGDGFLHPWDDTITIARSQGSSPAPQDLFIEVPDQKGNWVKAKDHLGIPAGRLKTVVIGLGGIFRPGAERKLRLRTSMEVYWDKLAWASAVPDVIVKTKPMPLMDADLRYRGFSLITQDGPFSPELAHYETLARTGPQWRNLEGYHTRYGGVRELLEKIDDRIVIAGSGDEVRMRFAAAPPTDEGWTRDFVFIGDGWMKEGDYNFRFSKTVLPLPYHAMKTYTSPLLPLETDRGYLLHPSDWQQFHTRYVSPEPFSRSLWDAGK